jgi:hypothetical protein
MPTLDVNYPAYPEYFLKWGQGWIQCTLDKYFLTGESKTEPTELILVRNMNNSPVLRMISGNICEMVYDAASSCPTFMRYADLPCFWQCFGYIFRIFDGIRDKLLELSNRQEEIMPQNEVSAPRISWRTETVRAIERALSLMCLSIIETPFILDSHVTRPFAQGDDIIIYTVSWVKIRGFWKGSKRTDCN